MRVQEISISLSSSSSSSLSLSLSLSHTHTHTHTHARTHTHTRAHIRTPLNETLHDIHGISLATLGSCVDLYMMEQGFVPSAVTWLNGGSISSKNQGNITPSVMLACIVHLLIFCASPHRPLP